MSIAVHSDRSNYYKRLSVFTENAPNLNIGHFRNSAQQILPLQEAQVFQAALATIDRKIGISINAFRGIALRVVFDETLSSTYKIELLHTNPELSLELESLCDQEEAIGHWIDLARNFNLPRLVERQEGLFTPCGGAVETPRRPPSLLTAKRRGRFLQRRKMGRPPANLQIHIKHEIISYE